MKQMLAAGFTADPVQEVLPEGLLERDWMPPEVLGLMKDVVVEKSEIIVSFSRAHEGSFGGCMNNKTSSCAL